MYKYVFSQVYHDISLSVYYSDGELYYSTRNIQTIAAFFRVVDVPKEGRYIITIEGKCTNEQIVAWYKEDTKQKEYV